MNKILTILFLLIATPCQAGWVSLDSEMLVSSCGYTSTWKPEDLLTPANDGWGHLQNHAHSLIIDLGYARDIKKFRFKDQGKNSATPDQLDLYCSLDMGTWGIAIANDIDISAMPLSTWTEEDVTDKSCRYVWFDVESTVRADNYLGWGDTSSPYEEIIQIWEGDVDKDTWTSYINLLNVPSTVTSTSYPAANYGLGGIPWDGSKFSNIANAYFEMTSSYTGTCSPNTAPTVFGRIYDVTNSAEICTVSDGSLSGGSVIRSADCSANLPAGPADLIVQVKNGCQTNSTISGARLVVVQEAGESNYMRAFIPVGGYETDRSLSYARLGTAFGNYVEKHYYWDEADWGTVDAAYFVATIKSDDAATTGYAILDTAVGGASMGEVSQVGTTWDLEISADISGSLVDNTTYTAWYKVGSSRKQVSIANAMIVVDLNPLTKYQAIYQFDGYGQTTSSTGWAENDNHMQLYDTGDTHFFSGVTEGNATYQTVLRHTSDTNMEASIYDDGVRNANADLLTTNTTFTRMESGALTIADDSEITQGYDLGASGFLKSGQVGDGKILKSITDIGPFVDVPERYVPRVFTY